MSAIFEYSVCERVLVSWMYSDVFFPAKIRIISSIVNWVSGEDER